MPEIMENRRDKANLQYRISASALAALGRVPLARLTMSGMENIADDGPQILAFSHHNSWDIQSLGAAVYRHNKRPVHFMAKHELLELPVVGRFLESMHGLPINRQEPQREQLEGALDVLEQGALLGIAPEGGRQRTREVKKLLGGVGFFAVRSNVSVVPIGIAGTELRRPIGPFIPRRIHLHAGTPIRPIGTSKNDRKEIDEQLRPALQEALDLAYELHPSKLD